MTLGGLALAVGILVDMSTVVVENIHTHLERGRPIARAVVDSGGEVALPLLISMLCVLAVFVPSFFMVGVAVANAILLVTFAERARVAEGTPGPLSAAEAAVEGARSRLRPILMTSLAMMAGMLPMALGLGESGEQTAPLGRAVVGGLAAATVATFLVLPSVFAIVQARSHRRSASLDPDDPHNMARAATGAPAAGHQGGGA